MSGNVFDGCVAKDAGLQCECRYCSFIKKPSEVSFPEGFPEWMKDYKALKALLQDDEVKSHEGRLNNQFTRLEKTEALAKKLDDKISAPTATPAAAVDYQPKINELDTKAKKLETSVGTLSGNVDNLSGKSQTLEQRVASIETLKIVERLTELEKKVKP